MGIIAKDGYEMTVSYSQIAAGDFLTYDMVTGAENEVEGTPATRGGVRDGRSSPRSR